MVTTLEATQRHLGYSHGIPLDDSFGIGNLKCIERNAIGCPLHPAMEYTEAENWDYKCRKLPHRAGVYIVSVQYLNPFPLHGKNDEMPLKALYVGLSGDIRQRFFKHNDLKELVVKRVAKHYGGVVHIDLLLDRLTFKSWEDMEQFLINSLAPEFNQKC